MAEIKEVKTEKITVNTGERIKISLSFGMSRIALTTIHKTTR